MNEEFLDVIEVFGEKCELQKKFCGKNCKMWASHFDDWPDWRNRQFNICVHWTRDIHWTRDDNQIFWNIELTINRKSDSIRLMSTGTSFEKAVDAMREEYKSYFDALRSISGRIL